MLSINFYRNLKHFNFFAFILRLENVLSYTCIENHLLRRIYESLFFISRDYRTTRINASGKSFSKWILVKPNILGFNFIYNKKTSVGFIGLFNMYVDRIIFIRSQFVRLMVWMWKTIPCSINHHITRSVESFKFCICQKSFSIKCCGFRKSHLIKLLKPFTESHFIPTARNVEIGQYLLQATLYHSLKININRMKRRKQTKNNADWKYFRKKRFKPTQRDYLCSLCSTSLNILWTLSGSSLYHLATCIEVFHFFEEISGKFMGNFLHKFVYDDQFPNTTRLELCGHTDAIL